MNFRIVTKNHAADPEIGFRTKSISKPYGRATVIPTAWVLINCYNVGGEWCCVRNVRCLVFCSEIEK